MSELTLEQKFKFLLAKKLKGGDVKAEMDTLSKQELIEFREWVNNKKAEAEEKLWHKNRLQRAEGEGS